MFKLSVLVPTRRASHVVVAGCLLLAFTGVTLAKGGSKSAAQTAPQVASQTTSDAEIQQKLQEFDQYIEAGQGAAAMNVFQSIKLKYPKDTQVRAYEAKILAMQNKMIEAVPVLESVLKDEPNHPLASALLANIEFRMGKKDEAQKRVTDALAVHPKAWELLQIAGEIKMAQQDNAGSLPYWRDIGNNVNNPATARMGAYAKLGMVASAEGRFTEAANMLNLALSIKWHPAVGMAYIQALDQDKQYTKLNDAIADMRKHLSDSKNPQFAQLRQQFETQIVPFETRAKQSNVTGDIAALDEDIISGKASYGAAKTRIQTLTATAGKEMDAQKKASLLLQLRQSELLTETTLLKDGLEKKYSLDWQKSIVAKVEKTAQGLTGPRVDEAKALTKQVTENINKDTLTQRESVLDLAGKGWTYKNFSSPNTEQLNELKARKLPERYVHFSSDLRKTLKDFYTPLAEKREKLELESATAELIKNPTDKAIKAKVARLLTDRVAQIDISKEGVTSFDVIPERVWTGPPGHTRPIDMDEKTYDRRELSYSIEARLGKYILGLNDRNEALIAGYSRALAVYPRQQTLLNRGEVYMYMGRYQEAWEDFAASVAVAAWEEANAPRGTSLMGGKWGVDGIPQVIVLDQMVKGKIRREGLYPATSVNAMLQGMRGKNWPAVADLVMEKYDAKSFESRILVDIRDGRHRDEILDALVDKCRKATSEEAKKEIMSKIDTLQSYHSHAQVDMLKAESEKDAEKRVRLLRSAVYAEPRNVKASYELAKQYEVVKQLEDAMLTYNIAAGGKLLTQTSGLAREAATARDRLSGPLANIGEAVKVYTPHMNNINKLILERRANKLHASQYEALLLLFLNYNGNRKAIVGRLADGQRAMHEYAQANESLKEYAKLLPDKKGMAMAMIARNETDLGLYEQASKSCDAAIEAGYKESWLYEQRGQLESYLGSYKQAVNSYTLAIQKQEDNTSALSKRSELYEYFYEDYDKAIADLESALGILKKKNPEANYFAMDLRLNNMKIIKARKALGM